MIGEKEPSLLLVLLGIPGPDVFQIFFQIRGRIAAEGNHPLPVALAFSDMQNLVFQVNVMNGELYQLIEPYP